MYGYDIETKAQLSQLKCPEESNPKKTRQGRSNVKVLLTVSFDCNSMVHREFLPQGLTIMRRFVRSNSLKTHRIVEKSIMDFAP